MGQLTSSEIVLEWSADPLSDTTPTYVTVSNNEILDIEWWSGVDREGSEPEPGGMVVVLKNVNRKWEPLFSTNTIDQGQRFRLTVKAVQEGIFYTQDFDLSFPTGETYSEVTITCADGFEVLALDDIELLDPPEADDLPDVYAFDEPFAHFRLGDPAGTQMVARTRIVRRGKGKNRRKIKVRSRQRVTTAELAGVTGAAGVYRGLPQLGQPSLILGDPDTSVLFGPRTGGVESYGRAAVESDQFSDPNAFTLECFVTRESAPGATTKFLGGPFNTTAATNTFALAVVTGSNLARLTVALTGGIVTVLSTTTVTAVEPAQHLAGTWDGTTARLYVNGVLEGEGTGDGVLRAGNANEYIYVGAGVSVGPVLTSLDVTLDEVAFYEHALDAERIMAHYQAGAERGWDMQTAGERIADIATHALWSEASIQTSGRDVQPEMKHGQARVDEISEVAHAEGPRTLFFFNGSGDPVYLGHEWKASAAVYNTIQATFGDTVGTIPYDEIEPEYDSEVYNDVTVSHEAGELANVTDATSISTRGRRANTEFTDVLLMEHNHVESLADHVLDLYSTPIWRPVGLTINASKAITQIKTLQIGYLVRVKKSGVTGAALDVITHIIGYKKHVDRQRNYTCTYTFGRGFDANDGHWRAGIHGYSEATSTTKAA